MDAHTGHHTISGVGASSVSKRFNDSGDGLSLKGPDSESFRKQLQATLHRLNPQRALQPNHHSQTPSPPPRILTPLPSAPFTLTLHPLTLILTLALSSFTRTLPHASPSPSCFTLRASRFTPFALHLTLTLTLTLSPSSCLHPAQARLQAANMRDSDLYNLLVVPLVKGDASRTLTRDVFIEGFKRFGYTGVPTGHVHSLHAYALATLVCLQDTYWTVGLWRSCGLSASSVCVARLCRTPVPCWCKPSSMLLTYHCSYLLCH